MHETTKRKRKGCADTCENDPIKRIILNNLSDELVRRLDEDEIEDILKASKLIMRRTLPEGASGNPFVVGIMTRNVVEPRIWGFLNLPPQEQDEWREPPFPSIRNEE